MQKLNRKKEEQKKAVNITRQDSAHYVCLFVFLLNVPFFEVFSKGINIICFPSVAGLIFLFTKITEEILKFSCGICNRKY
jgi:hypothetical protein